MKSQYPTEHIHRFAYTKLSERQISRKLKAAENGPSSTSTLSDALVGKSLKIVTDDGPELNYTFKNTNELSLTENNDASVNTGYGALTLDSIVFFSHMVPGTQKGYNVFVNQATNIATVIEVWFSGYEDNREVQREVYQGYVEQRGEDAPVGRHTITNRVEGKGFFWKQDNGIKTLEYYPSASYSNFVELSRFGGELSFCAPSDYIKINDDLYIYTRVECEFSGTMTAYVFNTNTSSQTGMRLGFDKQDDLEYYVFNGTGELLGQIAQFEAFGNVGDTVPEGTPPAGKGERRVYRPLKTNPILTTAEVNEAAKTPHVFAEYGSMAGNIGPTSDFLVGRELTTRYDNGPAIEYRFDEIQELRWRLEGERSWNTERYESWESTPGVIMFGHLMSGSPEHDALSIVVDLDHGLVTCLHATMGSPYIANEATVETWFGIINMEDFTPPMYRRHKYTDELVGRAVSWNYSPGLTSMHLYSTPHSLSWIIFGPDGTGGMEWSGPASYVKIRDDIYFAYWLEESCNGALGTILVNMRTMRNCGIDYHCGDEGLTLGSVGAHARHAGRFDVTKYFEIS